MAERVYHSQQLLTLHGLYSLYLLLSTLWLLCGSSGLLRKLAHPVHLKMHRCVIPLSPSKQKKPAWGSFCFGGESVSFATTSNPARTLFFIFASFHTIAFVRLIRFAHSRRKLAHPVHLKMHRCVIPRSPLWGLTRFRVVRVQPRLCLAGKRRAQY